jgi:hypothetical protein
MAILNSNSQDVPIRERMYCSGTRSEIIGGCRAPRGRAETNEIYQRE